MNSNSRIRKRDSEKVVKRNVCLPPDLDRLVGAILAKYGFNAFSEYVQAHVRNDAGLVLPHLPESPVTQ